MRRTKRDEGRKDKKEEAAPKGAGIVPSVVRSTLRTVLQDNRDLQRDVEYSPGSVREGHASRSWGEP